MSSNLSIAHVLADLEAQLSHLQKQEAFHTQQEAFHREERARVAAELERVRERFEAFRTAAAAVGEVLRSRTVAEDDGRKRPASKLIAQVIAEKGEHETFGPTSLAREVNERFAGKLRRPTDSRAVSVTLRRLLETGGVRLVQEGRAFHEAVYARRRK